MQKKKGIKFHSSKVAMNIQDVIKKFKFEKFAMRINVVGLYGDNWGLSWRKNWRNSKRRRQSITTNKQSSIVEICKVANKIENSKALWCYSMLINMYPKY